MKRILAIIMAALLVASLAACGNNSQTEPKETEAVTEGQKESDESTDAAASAAAAPTWKLFQVQGPGWKESDSAERYLKLICSPGLKD